MISYAVDNSLQSINFLLLLSQTLRCRQEVRCDLKTVLLKKKYLSWRKTKYVSGAGYLNFLKNNIKGVTVM